MRLKRFLLALGAILAGTNPVLAQTGAWNSESISRLRSWIAAAPDDALPRPDSVKLDRALASGQQPAIDAAATEQALKLARMHLLGAAKASEHSGWRIVDSDRAFDVERQLRVALAGGRVDDFFAGQRPHPPEYAVLRDAYRAETDPARRTVIARNMERWRWMPTSLGTDYLLVNAAAFELSRWRDGARVGAWRVIIGKTSSPTPVFGTAVQGVNLNPWWNVPRNIVRESVGALIRRSPATARARGYVWSGGAVRQKPGPHNALGQMKLVMPNPYSVYLHDTPNRDLFAREVRTLSHGCVRVDKALDLAESLLEGTRTRAEIDAFVASGSSQTVALARPIPVYIVYFTAGTRADGSFALFPDVYGRDKRVPVLARKPSTECSGAAQG